MENDAHDALETADSLLALGTLSATNVCTLYDGPRRKYRHKKTRKLETHERCHTMNRISVIAVLFLSRRKNIHLGEDVACFLNSQHLAE